VVVGKARVEKAEGPGTAAGVSGWREDEVARLRVEKNQAVSCSGYQQHSCLWWYVVSQFTALAQKISFIFLVFIRICVLSSAIYLPKTNSRCSFILPLYVTNCRSFWYFKIHKGYEFENAETTYYPKKRVDFLKKRCRYAKLIGRSNKHLCRRTIFTYHK
jgi:hypothetical protein